MQRLLNNSYQRPTILLLFSLILSASFWAGCEVINPEEPTPAFVHIDSFETRIDSISTRSQKITSVWAYYNNAPIGAFDLPATIPILADDKSGRLLLVPGVTYGGVDPYQIQYPFFLSYADTNITSGARKTITPVTRYINAEEVWSENFDIVNDFVNIEGDTGIARITEASQLFEGAGSGYISLRAPQTVSTNVATRSFRGGSECYLEMNYKCSMDIKVGLLTTDNTGTEEVIYLVGLNPRNTWNKVYISLNDVITKYPSRAFRVLIKTELGNMSEAYAAIDNLYVITR